MSNHKTIKYKIYNQPNVRHCHKQQYLLLITFNYQNLQCNDNSSICCHFIDMPTLKIQECSVLDELLMNDFLQDFPYCMATEQYQGSNKTEYSSLLKLQVTIHTEFG